jgi:hypothetical protein
MKNSSFSFKKIVLWKKVIFLKIFSISESNMICAEVKSPKVLQYSPIARASFRGHNCSCHVYMSQTLCLQFLVHVHAPSEFHGNSRPPRPPKAMLLPVLFNGHSPKASSRHACQRTIKKNWRFHVENFQHSKVSFSFLHIKNCSSKKSFFFGWKLHHFSK